MELFNLYATISANNSGFIAGITTSEKSFDKFKIGVIAGTAAITAAVVAAGKAAIDIGSAYEKQMSTVEAISGATAREMDKLSDKAREMGASTQFSAMQAGEAFEFMAMAGWKTTDMLNGLEGIMYAAGASGESLGLVADIITDGLTAFGLAADQSGRFADVLAAASSNANTNIGMMGETFKYVAPVAGSLGYSIEDVALATGLMANAGIKGSQAGTSMRRILLNLIKPSDATANAMDDLGISIANTDGTIKPFNELIGDLRETMGSAAVETGKMTAEEQAFYAATIAGAQAVPGLLAIVNAGEDDFNKLSVAIANSEGMARKMSEIRLNNLAGDITLMKSASEELAITAYYAFNDVMRNAVQNATDVIVDMGKTLARPDMQDGINAIGGAAGDLFATVMNAISKILPPLITLLGQVSKSISFVLNNLNVIIPVATIFFALWKGVELVHFISNSGGVIKALSTMLTSIVTSTVAKKADIAATTAQAIANGTATTAQLLLNAAMNANPVLLLITGVVALTAAITGLVMWIKRDTEEQKLLKKQTEETVESNNKLVDSLNDSAEAYNRNIDSQNAEFATTEKLTDRIFELSEAENKSAADKKVLQMRIDDLNASMGETILMYDEENDVLMDSSGNILDNTNATKDLIEQRRILAENELLIERERELTKELILLDEQMALNVKQQQDLDKAYDEGVIKKKEYKKQSEALSESLELLETTQQDYTDILEINSVAIEENTAKQIEATETQMELAQLLAETVEEYTEQQIATLDELSSTYSSIESAATSMFSTINDEAEYSVKELIENLEHNQKVIEDWADNIEYLANKGIDQGLLEELRKAGPESYGLVQTLVDANEDELDRLTEVYANSGEVAVNALSKSLGVSEDVAREAANLAKTAEDTLSQAITEAGFDDIGFDVVNGFTKGINDNVNEAGKAAENLSDSIIDTTKNYLDIHSPSVVFDEIGQNTVLGLIQGIETNTNVAIETVQTLINQIIEATNAELEANEVQNIGMGIVDNIAFGINESIENANMAMLEVSQTTKEIAVTEFTELSENVIDIMSELPDKIYDSIFPTIENVELWGETLHDDGVDIADLFVNDVMEIIDTLSGKFDDSINPIIDIVDDWGNELNENGKNLTQNFLDTIINIVTTLPNKFNNAIKPTIENTKRWAREVTKIVRDEFTQLGVDVVPLGENISSGIARGIRNRQGEVYSAAASLASGIADAIRRELDIHSPSRVMMGLGSMTADGFLIGLEDMQEGIDLVFSDLDLPESEFTVNANSNRDLSGSDKEQVVINQYMQQAASTPYEQQLYAKSLFDQWRWQT